MWIWMDQWEKMWWRYNYYMDYVGWKLELKYVWRNLLKAPMNPYYYTTKLDILYCSFWFNSCKLGKLWSTFQMAVVGSST